MPRHMPHSNASYRTSTRRQGCSARRLPSPATNGQSLILHKPRQHITDLAETVRRRVHSTNVDAKLAHLHDVLFDVVGFSGNVEDYYNPANSYLPEVLRTHRGLPITLVLIYKCVAEQVGLVVRGINSPGHFLAAVKSAATDREPTKRSDWMYVDPFYGGELLKRRRCLSPDHLNDGAVPSQFVAMAGAGDASPMAQPYAQQSAGDLRPCRPRTRSLRHAGTAGVARAIKKSRRRPPRLTLFCRYSFLLPGTG